MAYFYQHIKGLTSSETKWWIDCEKFDASSEMVTPEIRYIKNTQGSTEQNLGNIITSNMDNGVINKVFTFKNTINFYSGSTFKGYIGYDTYGLEIRGGEENNSPVLNINTDQVKYQGIQGRTQFLFQTPNTYTKTDTNNVNNTIEYTPIGFYIQTPNATSVKKGFGLACFDTIEGYTKWSAAKSAENPDEAPKTKLWANVPIVSEDFILSRNYIVTTGYVKAYNYVEGLYFNATSDKRAKTNITRSTFSALGLIKALPIYNFKYKSDGSDSIGIIAQEALNVSAGDFDLVCNPQASGENGNYMSVKESKLVYIAWKAIQEQQEIIDKQSKEIEELKRLVKTLIEK